MLDSPKGDLLILLGGDLSSRHNGEVRITGTFYRWTNAFTPIRTDLKRNQFSEV